MSGGLPTHKAHKSLEIFPSEWGGKLLQNSVKKHKNAKNLIVDEQPSTPWGKPTFVTAFREAILMPETDKISLTEKNVVPYFSCGILLWFPGK